VVDEIGNAKSNIHYRPFVVYGIDNTIPIMLLKIQIVLLFLLASTTSLRAQEVLLDQADKIRLIDAFDLSRQIGDSMWEGWSNVPFTLLLVTENSEFLFNHPNPTEDFQDWGYDSELQSNVYYRPNSGRFSTSFLATFPAINGQNTVVMGQPKATNKTSTDWVITALHEHFHQLQFSSPNYWKKVADLDLSGGDESGMWMLNFPYPYDSTRVEATFSEYEQSLSAAISNPELPAFRKLEASRQQLRQTLSEKEAKYQAFQLWQEGVARYTELLVAEWAEKSFTSSDAFMALPDYVSYSEAHRALMDSILNQLDAHAIAQIGRVVFYSAGAAEAYLLDFQDSDWKRSYFDDMPSLEAHTVKF
jgi:hypothetical protein